MSIDSPVILLTDGKTEKTRLSGVQATFLREEEGGGGHPGSSPEFWTEARVKARLQITSL